MAMKILNDYKKKWILYISKNDLNVFNDLNDKKHGKINHRNRKKIRSFENI